MESESDGGWCEVTGALPRPQAEPLRVFVWATPDEQPETRDDDRGGRRTRRGAW